MSRCPGLGYFCGGRVGYVAAGPAPASLSYPPWPGTYPGVLRSGEGSTALLPGLPPAPAQRHEYGTLDCTLEVVDSMQAAVDHLHA